MPSLIRLVYEVGSEAFIALAYRRVQTSERSGTQGTTERKVLHEVLANSR